MSAVPKKKLCWNCEGNVARETDNCPYCGVYVHSAETEDDSGWNPDYRPSESEEIPSPLYRIPRAHDSSSVENLEATPSDSSDPISFFPLLARLKEDLFPVLFLMTGSVFFLFGVILVLFSQNGTLTLQWQSRNGFYFLLLAFPLIGFGWRFLRQMHSE